MIVAKCQLWKLVLRTRSITASETYRWRSVDLSVTKSPNEQRSLKNSCTFSDPSQSTTRPDRCGFRPAVSPSPWPLLTLTHWFPTDSPKSRHPGSIYSNLLCQPRALSPTTLTARSNVLFHQMELQPQLHDPDPCVSAAGVITEDLLISSCHRFLQISGTAILPWSQGGKGNLWTQRPWLRETFEGLSLTISHSPDFVPLCTSPDLPTNFSVKRPVRHGRYFNQCGALRQWGSSTDRQEPLMFCD